MTKDKYVVNVDPDGIKLYEGAYQLHSKKYFAHAAQFIVVCEALEERTKQCTSVAWYLRGLSIELLCKGLLYHHDRKSYSPKLLRKKNLYGHHILQLIQELIDQKVIKITKGQLEAISQLNSFYFSERHELRYPSILSIFTEIKPNKKYEKPVAEVIKKLALTAHRIVGPARTRGPS